MVDTFAVLGLILSAIAGNEAVQGNLERGMDFMEVDPLWQQILQAGRLNGRLVHYCETLESTNSLALEMAKGGAEAGTVWVAETQTAGRGRLGKVWQSPRGTGLYCTVLIRPLVPLSQLSRVTLAAGLATAHAIDEISGLRSQIKWPNDVLLQGRKVAGVLVECQMSGGEEPALALGVGLNLTTSLEQFPLELRSRVTSLLIASGKSIGRGLMLGVLLSWLDRLILRLEKGDFVGILEGWRTKDFTLQKSLSWLTTEGRTVHGVSLGPDQEGLLVIRDSAGHQHHVLSGDLDLDTNTLTGYFP